MEWKEVAGALVGVVLVGFWVWIGWKWMIGWGWF